MFRVTLSVIGALLTVTLTAQSVFANLFKFSSNLGTGSPDAFALNGKGSQIVAMSNYLDNDNREVTIHITNIGVGGIEMSVPLVEFIPEHDFGVLDLVGDHITGQLLFVTEIDRINSAIKVYHATWYGDEWTLLQTIDPPTNTTSELSDPPYFFGSKFAVDHKSNRAVAVGYGDATPLGASGVGYGKVCVYEATSPAADEWLPTQVLTPPPSSSPTVLPIRMGGSFVNMHDDVIVTDTFLVSTAGAPADYGLEIYQRSRNGLWSHQQSLSDSSTTAHITLSVVYEQTIVYAINDLTAPTDVGKSSVHIMHPNTPEFQSSSSSRRLSHIDSKPKPKDSKKDSKPKPKPAKPKPTPIQWSVVQTLYSPNRDSTTPSSGSDVGFGQDMAIYGNLLTVSEVGDNVNTGFLYVYERTSKIGLFTMQQIIVPSIATNTFLSLHRFSNDMLMASSIFSTGGASNDIFLSNNTAWDCLRIKLEDAFGDGWDGARLRVTSPTKERDYYAPMCHTNPLVFRYCPSDFTQDGLYHLEIVGAKSAKFSWEINWLVYEESTGETYRGDQDTKMDFHFDSGAFSSRKISHELPTNATCQTCGGYPVPPPKPAPKPPAKPKPSPATPASSASDSGKTSPGKPSPAKSSPDGGHKRILHPSDDDRTPAPSISPAPTLAVTANAADWNYVSMTSAGGDWFRDEFTGTHFYISDVSGQKLISTGTMCAGVLSDSCVQSLSDGEYTLRVTGDLNVYSSDHTWAFCGRLGTASDSLTFSISNGVCTPLLRVTTSDTCLVINPVSGVAAYTVALGSFLMTGISKEGMTTADKQSFEEAVEHTVPGAVSGGAHVVSVANNGEMGISYDLEQSSASGVVVEFTVELKTQDMGYDLLDIDSLEEMINMEQQQLSTSSLSQKVVSELLGATRNHGSHSFFSDVFSVKLLSFQMGDLEFAKSPLTHHTTKNTETSKPMTDLDFVLADLDAAAKKHDEEMKTLFEVFGIGGYILAAVAMAGVLVVMRKKRAAMAHNNPSIVDESLSTADRQEVTVSI